MAVFNSNTPLPADSRLARIKPRALSIATINANSVAGQRDLIRDFNTAHQLDILCVQESFLKPSIRDPKITNYRLIRNDRLATKGGGTLIYYKKTLHWVPLDPPAALENIEAYI